MQVAFGGVSASASSQEQWSTSVQDTEQTSTSFSYGTSTTTTYGPITFTCGQAGYSKANTGSCCFLQTMTTQAEGSTMFFDESVVYTFQNQLDNGSYPTHYFAASGTTTVPTFQSGQTTMGACVPIPADFSSDPDCGFLAPSWYNQS